MLLLSTIISLISFSIMSHIYAFATLNPKLILPLFFCCMSQKAYNYIFRLFGFLTVSIIIFSLSQLIIEKLSQRLPLFLLTF